MRCRQREQNVQRSRDREGHDAFKKWKGVSTAGTKRMRRRNQLLPSLMCNAGDLEFHPRVMKYHLKALTKQDFLKSEARQILQVVRQ